MTFVLGMTVIPIARLKATKTGKSQNTYTDVSEGETVDISLGRYTDGLLNHTARGGP